MDMLSFLFAVVLLAIAMAGVVLRKTYYFVPPRELKRQAEAGDQVARTLYRAVAYGGSLRALLWLVIAAASAGGFVVLARLAPAWMGFVAVVILLWLAFSWLPNSRVTSLGARLAVWLTPAIAWTLNHVHPLLDAPARRLQGRYAGGHTGLFERQDIIDLLDAQSRQPDSRVTAEEIDLVKHVLNFSDYKVRDVLRPRTQIKSVSAGDAIGPVLLDELHASGQSSFPVKKSARGKEIIGTLHLNDIGIHSSGTVADHMTGGVTYIHESDNLADALHVFYQTKRQLFVVVNSFEEYVGIITMEDILHQLVGRPEPNETLGSHDDPAAVAARHPQAAPSEVIEPDATEKPAEEAGEPITAELEPELVSVDDPAEAEVEDIKINE